MARSEYVYVVTQHGNPIAGFTVKYEMEGWLNERDGPLPSSVRVFRIRNLDQSVTELLDYV